MPRPRRHQSYSGDANNGFAPATALVLSASTTPPSLSNLVADSQGNLYGTTGGTFNTGTIFEEPFPGNDAEGNPTYGPAVTLYSFSNEDPAGYSPLAQRLLYSQGELIGTTNFGAYEDNLYGTVFAFNLSTATMTVLGAPSGGSMYGNLLMDGQGNVFGIGTGSNGLGSVFEIKAGSGTLTTLVNFSSSGPFDPESLVMDGQGNLFGLAGGGGEVNDGAVFEIKATGTDAQGNITYSPVVTDLVPSVNEPIGLAIDQVGNLYYTTDSKGTYNAGNLFELPVGSTSPVTLYNFTQEDSPNDLFLDSQGNLFGTTVRSDTFELPTTLVTQSVVAAQPTLTAAAGVIGDPVLIDTATLTGGYNPTGTLTFNLYYQGGSTPVDTETVAVNGNGTYTTPTGYTLPANTLVAGDCQWTVSYSGDDNNEVVSAVETINSLPQVISFAALTSPITYAPGETVTLRATGGSSGNPVTFSIDAASTGQGVISGNMLTITQAGTLVLDANQAGSGIFADANTVQQDLVVAKANAAIAVTPYSVTYDGNAHTAVGTATGVDGTNLSSELQLSGTTHTGAGNYSDAWSFTGDSDYNAASGLVTDSIAQAASSVTLTAAGGNYDGTTVFAATAAASGAGTLTGAVSLDYYDNSNNADLGSTAPVNAGSYTVTATYAGDANHSGSSTSASFTIQQTASSVSVTDAGGTYDGSTAFAATASLSGAGAVTGGMSLDYYDNTTETDLGSTAPVNAGSYTVTATYAGDTNHTSSTSAAAFTVQQATPSVSVTDAGGTYDGSTAFAATASVSGAGTVTGSPTIAYYLASDINFSNPLSAPVAAGSYVAVATYAGDANHTGSTNSVAFTVQQASPTLTGTPSSTAVTLGTTAPTLKDSAVLAAGHNETGSVTFKLVSPGGATVDTETVTVNGNNTYTTPTGYTLPTTGTVIGTYQWNVSYSGDGNNKTASDNNDTKEQVTVSKASPTLTGTPSSTAITLGTTAPTLKDSAVLAAGYYETGSVTFKLVAPGGATVDTETVTLSGNNTYTTPTSYTLPTTGTVSGTYQWNVSYSGDGNNNTASDNNDTKEQVTVSKASPTLTAIASTTNATLGATTVVIGTGAKLTASATLSGGYHETGTITFTLYSPSNSVVDTETATVSGNGTSTTPNGYLPTVAGTYQWVASYSDDANNNGVSTTNGSTPEVVVGSGLTVVSTALYLVGGSTTNDQLNITSTGTSQTGSTGINVSGQLNNVYNINQNYSQSFTTLYVVSFTGNDNFQFAGTLTIPVVLSAGNGNDQVQLDNGNNTVSLGNGNDQVQSSGSQGGNGNNTISVGNGNDQVRLGNGINSVTLGNGNDSIQLGTNSNESVSAGSGSDQVNIGSNNSTGADSHETVTLGNGNDSEVVIQSQIRRASDHQIRTYGDERG